MKHNLKIFLLSLVFCVLATVRGVAQSPRLSDFSKISVFTIGPGDELFSKFGHSAIRVMDPQHSIDIVFDYGVFDFDEPNFYLKFARGKLKYRLAADTYDRFYRRYQYYGRSLTEQQLNLNLAQRQAVFDFLSENYKPENRYYLYDFFYDNCASRLKDVMVGALGENVRFDNSPLEEQRSFREMTDLYLGYAPWGDLGIDLGLGLPADVKADRLELMFLPDYVLSGFEDATVNVQGDWQPLVASTEVVLEPAREEKWDFVIPPRVVFWALFILVLFLTFAGIKRGWRRSNLIDVPLFFISGLAGLLIVFLWFFTDHAATADNLNVLWALPTHAFFVWTLLKKQVPAWARGYFLAIGVLNVLLLLSWQFLPQLMPHAIIPFVLLLGLRGTYIYFTESRKVRQQLAGEAPVL